MNKIGCWNTWGLNSTSKQINIWKWTLSSLLGIIGLLETKIAPANMNTIIPGTSLSGWKFLSNSSASSTCRILVGWEPIAFDLSCFQFSEQWVTCEVTSLATKDKLKITFVYGLNTWAGRGLLRSYIKQHASLYSDTWVHLRDFNAITVLWHLSFKPPSPAPFTLPPLSFWTSGLTERTLWTL